MWRGRETLIIGFKEFVTMKSIEKKAYNSNFRNIIKRLTIPKKIMC